MSEENVEKSKKAKRGRVVVRHRSERRITYENLNRPSHAPTPHPVEDAAEECAAPDVGKGTMGNAVPPSPGSRPVTDRLSPSRVTGGAALSTGDHNASANADPMSGAGPRSIAYGHQDMRQSNTSFNDVIARLRTVNGDNANGDRDVTYTAGQVGLNLFNARGQAGQYGGMAPVGHDPNRPGWHTARNSATPPNGTHGLADVRSHAAPTAAKSMTGSEALRVMRQNQRKV